MGTPGRLISMQVGMPQQMMQPEEKRMDFRNQHWTSGIFKSAVHGPLVVAKTGLPGDGQADLKNHGGPDNVVLAFAASRYAFFRHALGMPELGYGSFGENFTVEGFEDATVCIGDIWRVGTGPESVTLQVTQPRQPCYKLGRRIGHQEVVKLATEQGCAGWYLRVLQEGQVEVGMPIERLEQPHPEWPVRDAVWVMYARKKQPDRARQLSSLPELSARWKIELLEA